MNTRPSLDAPQVLILTRRNVPVHTVVQGLRRRGIAPVVLQTDRFPAEVTVSRDAEGLTVRDGDVVHRLDRLGAIWYRRMGLGIELPPQTPSDVVKGVMAESRSHLLGVVAGAGVYVLSAKHSIDHTDLKPRQLSLAARAGLEVPPTLVTTDAAAARRFFEAHDEVVTKVFTSFQLQHDGEPKVVMTRRLTSEDLPSGDELALCPTVFQARVPRRREWRITVVGRKVFSAAFDGAHLASDEVDWRRRGHELKSCWHKAELPASVVGPLLTLMDRLGLDYGAADFIETPDGRFVFLEVNPAGEYLWLDRLFDGGISDAIAELLASMCPSTTPKADAVSA